MVNFVDFVLVLAGVFAMPVIWRVLNPLLSRKRKDMMSNEEFLRIISLSDSARSIDEVVAKLQENGLSDLPFYLSD